MRANLLTTLKKWIENPTQSGSYTFLSNNCVGALAKLMKQAGFPTTTGLRPIIPTNFDEWLKQSMLSPFPALKVESAKNLIEQTTLVLKISEDDLLSGQNWPENATSILNESLSNLQIKQLLMQFTKMPTNIRNELAQTHNFRSGGATLEEVMTFKIIPQSLYTICTSSDCMEKNIELGKIFWTKDAWADAIRANDFAFWLVFGNRNARDGEPLQNRDPYDAPAHLTPKSLKKNPEIIRYYQMLLRQQTN